MYSAYFRALLHRLPRPPITSRAIALGIAALVLYFFANQTQVGWLYVLAALLAGIVGAAGWLNRAALRGLSATRTLGLSGAVYEGDPVQVTLTVHAAHGTTHVRVHETCPLAAPDDRWRELDLFIPGLTPGAAARFSYTVTADRRGLHAFPTLGLHSSAPFGCFMRTGHIPAPAHQLVYPEVRTLTSLDLLDRRLAELTPRPRAGVGAEVLGVRPFRTGDSQRHIHWRSVARTQRLISKEFADESQPGVTLALDLRNYPYPSTLTKHTPFEWAVKIAASIGTYALKRGYPLNLLADPTAWPAPNGAVTHEALLQYLARIQPTGAQPFADILRTPGVQAYLIALVPWPHPALVPALGALARRAQVLAVLLDPLTFPVPATPPANPHDLRGALQAAGVESCTLSYGDDWRTALAGHLTPQGVAA